MSPRSVGRTVLGRVWMPVVAVVALALGAVIMWKVQGLPPWVKMRTPGVRTLSPAGVVGSMGEPVFDSPRTNDC